MLEFCPMCKRLLVQKEENNILIGACSCGFKRTAGINISTENISNKKLIGEGVSNNSSENALNSSVEKICLKCGFDRATIFEIASNESNIFVYRCLKCFSTQREVQGSSKF